jgi:hypothetical protein
MVHLGDEWRCECHPFLWNQANVVTYFARNDDQIPGENADDYFCFFGAETPARTTAETTSR